MSSDMKIGSKITNRKCRICGCTDVDCSQCIAKTGQPCHWLASDLCSACRDDLPEPAVADQRKAQDIVDVFKPLAEVAARLLKCSAVLKLDGNKWCATRGDYVNLQESPAGFGDTELDAIADLIRAECERPQDAARKLGLTGPREMADAIEAHRVAELRRASRRLAYWARRTRELMEAEAMAAGPRRRRKAVRRAH
jgi:hypothetical protein